MRRRLGVLAVLVVIVPGCATRGSVNRLQAEVDRLHSEAAAFRVAQEAAARDLDRTVADLRSLDARALELQASLRESSAELSRLRLRLDAAESEARAARAAPSPGGAAAASAPPAERLVRGRIRPEPERVETPERAYNQALATFRAREHGQAVLELLDFLARYPKHPLAPNAQYWIGEAYYVQRDYRQALVEFQRVLQMAPASPKVPDALLKIGLCHTNLREPAPAEQAWQRLVRDYPAAAAAGKARAQLRARSITPR